MVHRRDLRRASCAEHEEGDPPDGGPHRHAVSDLLAALKAGEMTDTIRTSLQSMLRQVRRDRATVFIGVEGFERAETGRIITKDTELVCRRRRLVMSSWDPDAS